MIRNQYDKYTTLNNTMDSSTHDKVYSYLASPNGLVEFKSKQLIHSFRIINLQIDFNGNVIANYELRGNLPVSVLKMRKDGKELNISYSLNDHKIKVDSGNVDELFISYSLDGYSPETRSIDVSNLLSDYISVDTKGLFKRHYYNLAILPATNRLYSKIIKIFSNIIF